MICTIISGLRDEHFYEAWFPFMIVRGSVSNLSRRKHSIFGSCTYNYLPIKVFHYWSLRQTTNSNDI